MNFEEWLRNIQFRLRRKYKIMDTFCGDCGIKIRFENNFTYEINQYELVHLWNQMDLDSFKEICAGIEKSYVNQIMNS